MRLWSLHPRHLDRRALVAVWREALLAQAVLRGRTKGYRRHPQLDRFRATASPTGAIAAYLRAVRDEATARSYAFDGRRIGRGTHAGTIPVTRGQIDLEWAHLVAKVTARDAAWLAKLSAVAAPAPHPLFRVRPGAVEPWERAPRSGMIRPWTPPNP